MLKQLEGVRVLESATLFTGDHLGALLGDLGADVIKIESPFQGDYLRDFLGQVTPHNSPAHLQINKNKRSVTLDLRKLRWRNDAGEPLAHAPDFFARRSDGSALVVDCRPVERRPPRDVAKFDATAEVCALLGWEYRLVGATDPVVTANVRWLAGYRHPRHRLAGTAESLRSVFTTPAC
jgi:CoA transferase family III